MLKARNRTNFIIIDPLVVGAGSMADRWRTLKPGVGMRDMKANLNFSEYFLEIVKCTHKRPRRSAFGENQKTFARYGLTDSDPN